MTFHILEPDDAVDAEGIKISKILAGWNDRSSG